MKYDASRYCAPLQRPQLVDRWTTETRRNYVKRDQEPSVIVEGNPTLPTTFPAEAPIDAKRAPGQRSTVSDMISEIKHCKECSAVQVRRDEGLQPGAVSVERPPFHCYHMDSANVLPPRPIREEVYYDQVAAARAARPDTDDKKRPSSRDVRLGHPLQQWRCTGCRFCHHASHSDVPSTPAAELAEVVELRREALKHRRHEAKRSKTAASKVTKCPARPSTAKADTLLCVNDPAPKVICESSHHWAQLRSTSLVLCAACGRVVNRQCDSDESLMRFLGGGACEGCGTAGQLMRLLAEDCRRRSELSKHADPSAYAGAPTSSGEQHRTSRPHTPMDDYIDAIELLPSGVVPMEDRRTVLGERIRVGRARVPSPARQAAMEALASNPTKTPLVQRWLQEPQSANDSEKAKLCLTWDA